MFTFAIHLLSQTSTVKEDTLQDKAKPLLEKVRGRNVQRNSVRIPLYLVL